MCAEGDLHAIVGGLEVAKAMAASRPEPPTGLHLELVKPMPEALYLVFG